MPPAAGPVQLREETRPKLTEGQREKRVAAETERVAAEAQLRTQAKTKLIAGQNEKRFVAKQASLQEHGAPRAAAHGPVEAPPPPASQSDALLTTPLRFGIVLHSWDAGNRGQEYMSLTRGDRLQFLQPPDEPEGWSYGALVTEGDGMARNKAAWLPPACVAELEDF